MAFCVRVTTLYIGQGQCNVVEVYNDPYRGVNIRFNLPPRPPNLPLPENQTMPVANVSNLVFLALVDVGSGNAANRNYGNTDINYAVNYIINLAISRTNPAPLPIDANIINRPLIDQIYISHNDNDHKNLISAILQRMGPGQRDIGAASPWGAVKLDVTNILICGDNFGVPNVALMNIVNEMYMNNRFEHIVPAAPGNPGNQNLYGGQIAPNLNVFGGGAPNMALFYIHAAFNNHYHLRIHPIMARFDLAPAVPPNAANSVSSNEGSLMLLLTVTYEPVGAAATPVFSYLFTGDGAQQPVFARMNHLLGIANFNNECKAMMIPHHGTPELIGDDLRRFLCFMRPHLAVSSGKSSGYGHPRLGAMEIFRAFVLNQGNIPLLPPVPEPAIAPAVLQAIQAAGALPALPVAPISLAPALPLPSPVIEDVPPLAPPPPSVQGVQPIHHRDFQYSAPGNVNIQSNATWKYLFNTKIKTDTIIAPNLWRRNIHVSCEVTTPAFGVLAAPIVRVHNVEYDQ